VGIKGYPTTRQVPLLPVPALEIFLSVSLLRMQPPTFDWRPRVRDSFSMPFPFSARSRTGRFFCSSRPDIGFRLGLPFTFPASYQYWPLFSLIFSFLQFVTPDSLPRVAGLSMAPLFLIADVSTLRQSPLISPSAVVRTEDSSGPLQCPWRAEERSPFPHRARERFPVARPSC